MSWGSLVPTFICPPVLQVFGVGGQCTICITFSIPYLVFGAWCGVGIDWATNCLLILIMCVLWFFCRSLKRVLGTRGWGVGGQNIIFITFPPISWNIVFGACGHWLGNRATNFKGKILTNTKVTEFLITKRRLGRLFTGSTKICILTRVSISFKRLLWYLGNSGNCKSF